MTENEVGVLMMSKVTQSLLLFRAKKVSQMVWPGPAHLLFGKWPVAKGTDFIRHALHSKRNATQIEKHVADDAFCEAELIL